MSKVRVTKIAGNGEFPIGFWMEGYSANDPVIKCNFTLNPIEQASDIDLLGTYKRFYMSRNVTRLLKVGWGFFVRTGDNLWSWEEID